MADIVNVGKMAMDVRKSELAMPYSKVIVNVTKQDNSVISYEAGDDTGLTLEVDCPWGNQQIANDMLEKVRGYQYQPYTVTTAIVDPAVEMGDVAQTNGVFGGVYQQDSEFTHTFYSSFSAPQEEQIDHEYTFESPIERRLARQEAYSRATFSIQHDNIEAKVAQKGGDVETNSFAWRLLSDHFSLYSGSKEVFKCHASGIIVDGEIKARTGYIGTDSSGFHIGDKSIYNGKSSIGAASANQQQGVYVGTDGIALGMVTYDNVKYDAFSVTKNGVFTARTGYIGNGTSGFTINNKSIYNGPNTMTSTASGSYIGTDGIRVYQDETHNYTFGKSNSTFKIMAGKSAIGAATASQTQGVYIGTDGIALGRTGSTGNYSDAFSVTSAGVLKAKSGSIGSDASAWNIGAKSLYNGTDSMTSSGVGAYVGIDGIRVYQDATHNYTFGKSNNTFKIMAGKSAIGAASANQTQGVYIGTDGIALGRTGSGTNVSDAFSVTSAGVLKAKSGTIGSDTSAWEIGTKSLYNGTKSMTDTTVGAYVGIDGIRIYQDATHNYTFGKSNNTFKIMAGKSAYNDANNGVYVGTDGLGLGSNFYVTNSGSLTAKSGTIGSDASAWNIGTKNLWNGTTSMSDTNVGAYVGIDGIRVYQDATHNYTFGKSNNTFKIMAGKSAYNDANTGVYVGTDGLGLGSNFHVTSSGSLTAKSGTIGSDANAWIIGTKSIYNGTESIDDNKQGTYLGIDGIRIYNSATESFTFKKNGTIEIKKGMTSIDDKDQTSGMYIGNDGIVLGGGKFRVYKDGTLTAKSGTIGNSDTDYWTIGTKSIFNGTDGMTSVAPGAYVGTDGIRVYQDETHSYTFGKSNSTFKIMAGKASYNDANTGVYIGTDGIGLGNNKFYVTSTGDMTATGTITAKSGRIGADANGNDGFVIAEKKLYSDGKTGYNTATEGVYIGTDGIGLGNKAFYVKKDGTLYAKTGKFEGTIYLETLSFTKTDGTTPVTIDGSKLTDSTVDGGTKISGKSIPKKKIDDDTQAEITHGQNAYDDMTTLKTGHFNASQVTVKQLSINDGRNNWDLVIGGKVMKFVSITVGETTYHVLGY